MKESKAIALNRTTIFSSTAPLRRRHSYARASTATAQLTAGHLYSGGRLWGPALVLTRGVGRSMAKTSIKSCMKAKQRTKNLVVIPTTEGIGHRVDVLAVRFTILLFIFQG